MHQNRQSQTPGRRDFIAAAVMAGVLSHPLRGFAAGFPTRSITMVSPFVAGGPNDIVGRVIAEPLSQVLNQSVLVDNVTGAGGLIGARKVLTGPADGYTLLIGAAYLVTAPYLYKAATFDPARDLIPVSPPVESSLVFVSAKFKDLKSLVENAKKTNQPIRLASPGAGTLSHLGGEMLSQATGAPMVHIAYRGSGPAMTDVIGGHADLMLDGISSSLAQIRDGRLTALAVPDDQRNPLLPNAPTMGQLGWPGVNVRAWNAIFAKAGTPADVVELLTTEITKIVNRPEVSGELSKRGLDPSSLTAAAFRQRMGVEATHWKSVIQAAKITAE